jgi:hypothetical protein
MSDKSPNHSSTATGWRKISQLSELRTDDGYTEVTLLLDRLAG